MSDFISDAEMAKQSGPSFISDEQMNDSGFIEGLKTAGNALMYNSNKLGAGMAAGVANIGEAAGVDMNTSRGVQDFYKENAKQYEQPDHPFIQEAYNPLNYTVGGKGAVLAGSLIGSAFANEGANSATTGEDFDTGRASNQAAIGLAVDPAIQLAKMGGKSFNSLLRRTLVGADSTTTKEIETLQKLAEKHGIELTPATTTGSPSLARMEHNLNDSAAAGLGLRQAVNSEKTGVDNAIVGQFDKMGANGSNVGAGEVFAQGTKSLVEREKQYFTDTFNKLFAAYGDQQIFSIKTVKSQAKTLVDQAERNPIIKNTTAYRDAKALSNTDDYLKWADWQQLRTQLGGLTQDSMLTGKASSGTYKQLYSGLADDLKTSVYSMENLGMLHKYNNAIDEYKVFKQGLDGKSSGAGFMKSVMNDRIAPETIGHNINGSTLKATSALDVGGWDKASGIPMAKKASATDTLLSSMNRTGDGISMPNFLKATDKEGFKTAAAAATRTDRDGAVPRWLLQDEVIPNRSSMEKLGTKGADNIVIDDLREIAKAVKAKDSYKNTSKTAIYNQINWAKANPVSAVLMFAKDAAMSASYRSDVFKRWLSKGGITKTQYDDAIKVIQQTEQASPNRAKAVNVLFNSNEQ